MSDNTNIEWTATHHPDGTVTKGATWNPVSGCSKVSAGCKHCYAEQRDWVRLSANPQTRYFGRAFTDVQCHPEILDQPLRWKRPRRIFVNSMSDLFHEAVPLEFIAAVFGAMSHARRHTFQILTKRPARMLEFFSWLARQVEHKVEYVASINHAEFICGEETGRRGSERAAVEACAITAYYDQSRTMNGGRPHGSFYRDWPLPNVWIGVTAENQEAADERVPLLLQTPAAVRFVSVEPMVGPVDLYGGDPDPRLGGTAAGRGVSLEPHWMPGDDPKAPPRPGIDWVIVGGESGPKARPTHPDWVRSLRDQCAAAGVPFMFKQWGTYAPSRELHNAGVIAGHQLHTFPWGQCNPQMARIGKKAAGRLLDGREHLEYPAEKKS